MPGFTKLHNTILDSSVWEEDYATRIVWITLLAKTDRDGIVEASIPGLARAARVSIEEVQAALDRFMKPDPWSRTPDDEGRRIEAIPDGGWRLLNYEKYRDKLSPEDRRERERVRKQRQRDRKRMMSRESGTKRDSHGLSRMSRHAEAEPEAGGKDASPVLAGECLKDLEPFAKDLLLRLNQISNASLLNQTCQAIAILMRVHGVSPKEATERLYADRQSHSYVAFNFWLSDGTWKSAK